MKLFSKIALFAVLGIGGGMLAQVFTSTFAVGVGSGVGGNPVEAMSGGSITQGTCASIPSETDGAYYQATDAPYHFIGASGAWVAFTSIGLVTPPVSGTPNFAWANQGSAAVSNTHCGEIMTAPVSSGDQLRIRYIAAPMTPYSITLVASAGEVGAQYVNAGLCFYNSSSGKVVTFGNSSNLTAGIVQNLVVQTWNSVSSINSASTTVIPFTFGAFTVLKVRDDGTNFTFSASSDGINFIQFYQVADTNFLTPQSVGYFIDVNNATYTASYWAVSWVQGS